MSRWRAAASREVARPPAAQTGSPFPKVILVGGPDVDARLELMRALRGTMQMSALGSRPALRTRFMAEGFGYDSYVLSRRARPILDALTVGQLVLVFRRTRPHIVHAFDTKPGVLACLAARAAGVPIVIGTVTGLGALYAAGAPRARAIRRVYEVLQRLACRASDATIFQNPDDVRWFIAAGMVSAEKVVLLPGSGIDTARFDPARISTAEQFRVRAELGIRPGDLVVTMVARVIRSKGVLEFADAARSIRANRPHVHFVLLGAAGAASASDTLTAPELAQLRGAVTWPGARPDVPVVLSVSDVFVLPSRYAEGIPRALLEAASMGLPIVTVDAPGCREAVLPDVTGFLVSVHPRAALGTAILRLLDEPDLRRRFGRMARLRTVQRFDLAVVAAQTRAVYEHHLLRKGLRAAPPAQCAEAR